MSAARFHISDTNPNDQIGGGGCVCSDTKTDCKGPYAVFYATETDSNISPHVVVGMGCVRAVAKAARGEKLSTSADRLEDVPKL